MYAILETGGKQYRVQPGDTIAVERLSGDPGQTLDQALAVGKQTLEGHSARYRAVIEEQRNRPS